MERGFYNEDFEQLIKQKADQYKMFPSDHVWMGIHRSLHTRRKWYWLGFLLFLAGIGYYAMVELMTPGTSVKRTADKQNPAASPSPVVTENIAEKAIVVPFTPVARHSNPAAANHPAGTNSTTNDLSLTEDELPASNPALVNINNDAETAVSKETPVYDLQTGSLKKVVANTSTALRASLRTNEPGKEHYPLLENLLADPIAAIKIPAASMPMLAPEADKDKKSVEQETGNEDMKRINWLQEFAVYDLKPPPMKRIGWQIAFSPTMNYRKLTGNAISNPTLQQQPSIKNVPIATDKEIEPEKLVNHKPALGFELGTHILYALNKNIRLRAGLQFNYSRYDIQAYTSSTPEQATIALDNTGGRRGTDSITSLTRIGNFGGDQVQDLRNQYFQFAAPVGLEMRILGNEIIQLNVAGTIQPTYLLNRNTYLISTDYKNYTRQPSLVRRWNVNTSAELFVSLKTGGLKWQVGPQFRYQLFSSYIKEYPIREYLMEYGIKIGVTKTIR